MKTPILGLVLLLGAASLFFCSETQAFCSNHLPREERQLCEQVTQARKPGSDCNDRQFIEKSGPLGGVNCRAFKELSQGGDCSALLKSNEWEAAGRCSAIQLGFLVSYVDGMSCDDDEENLQGSLAAISALWKQNGHEKANAGEDSLVRGRTYCKLGVFLAESYPSFMKQRRLALQLRTDFDPELAGWLEGQIAKNSCHTGTMPLAENLLDLIRDSNHALLTLEGQLGNPVLQKSVERAKKVRTLAQSLYEHYRNLRKPLGEVVGESEEDAAFQGITPKELRKYFGDVVKTIEKLRQSKVSLEPKTYARGAVLGNLGIASPIEFELSPDGKIRLHIQRVPTERGDVEIEHREGSFKAQYLGVDYDSGELFAVGKVRESIQGESRKGVLLSATKEAQKQSKVHSPRVARAFTSGHETTSENFAIIQEYLPYTLGSYPKKPDGFSSTEERNVFIADQLIDSLRELQRNKTVHRDIKSDNIMVKENPATGEPETKLIDFGYAKLGPQKAKTKSEMTLQGTPQYLSPAAVRKSTEPLSPGPGKTEYRDMRRDPVWDFFAMGVVLYEMAHPGSHSRHSSIEEFFKGLLEVHTYDDLCRVSGICFSDRIKKSDGPPKTVEELAFRLLDPSREHFKMEEVSAWMQHVKHEFEKGAEPGVAPHGNSHPENPLAKVLSSLQNRDSSSAIQPRPAALNGLLTDLAQTHDAEFSFMPGE